MTRAVRSLAAAGVLSAAALVTVPPPAYAGGCTGVCSETVNDSNSVVTVGRNYCQTGITGSRTTTKPTCSSDGVKQQWKGIGPGEQSPDGQDWDTFRVDANWCYEVYFEGYFPWNSSWTAYYKASSGEPTYVKVGNDHTAYIKRQTYRSCPAT
ncbi:hypothetical protein ACFRCG_03035 [Embleya sp. NPDC056575]|uniref:hypothetical protein n=1 Tax=unclassified Embleya TaxID=2699296 RepID=UPI003674A91C